MSTIRDTHIGVVTDTADPEQRGRIKVACASLMGMDADGKAVEYPNWVEPVFGWRTSSLDTEADGEGGTCGFFFVPGVGTSVEIEITEASTHDQSPGQASITSPDPRYRGCLLSPGEDIGDDFKTNYPARFGWKAPNGAVFYFDPTKGSEKISIQSHEIDGARSFFAIDDKGSITTATANGVLFKLDAVAKTIVMVDGYGNLIQTTKDGYSLISAEGPVIMAKGASITLMTSGQVLVNSGHTQISSASVALGANAIEAIIKGNTFQTLFNTHTHIGNLGAPTAPPLVPLTGAELSTVVKAE